MAKCTKCGFLKSTPDQKCWCNKPAYKGPSLEKKKPKPIAPISEKKKKENKERIEKNGTYEEFFAKCFKTRVKKGTNFCMVTGKEISPEYIEELRQDTEGMHLNCFPHILAKGIYKQFAYFQNNVGLCMPDQHKNFDMAVSLMIEDVGKPVLVEKISSGEEIDLSKYVALLF